MKEVASSWKHFLNQRGGQTFHYSFKFFFVLIQFQMWSDMLISASSTITILFLPNQYLLSNWWIVGRDRQNKTEEN